MPLLLESVPASLKRGDILRLPENYDLGPGSGPVDVMVYYPFKDGCGMGLLTVSGYKAGHVFAILPERSGGPHHIDVKWLTAHWDEWFCYAWGEEMIRVDISKTILLEWDRREIVEKM